jgi:hypothetical protein
MFTWNNQTLIELNEVGAIVSCALSARVYPCSLLKLAVGQLALLIPVSRK